MMMYTDNKEEIDDIPFTSKVPITEKIVKWELLKNNVPEDKIESQAKVNSCPFTKSKVHKADFLIISENGERLYIEVKGQMTYSEVNKLRFLLEKNSNCFYILQLTEIDWIEEVSSNANLSDAEKSKKSYEQQFLELSDFYKGTKTAEEMNKLSIERLKYFIKVREKDVEKWETLLRSNIEEK